MSIEQPNSLPDGDSKDRATAKETVYRLSAIAFGHPTEEFYEVLADGSFGRAFDLAWSALSGRVWPQQPASSDFTTLESGFISAFLHGKKGKPAAPLLAGDYAHLLSGQDRPSFMLNISSFYRHFGLKAATADEGRADEPDHLASMLEFMAVLSHLEGQALACRQDPSSYRRAQRDFLKRYLEPLLCAIREALGRNPVPDLDPFFVRLSEDLPDWLARQIVELEARVGAYSESSHITPRPTNQGAGENQESVVEQNLWG